MPKKLPIVTEAYLKAVSLPNHASSYTVISHGFIIDTVKQALRNTGLAITDEKYVISDIGQVALGSYTLKNPNDSELDFVFNWINSYNKKIRFGCVIGASNSTYKSYYIPGNVSSWVRKHTGTADQEASQTIVDQIGLMDTYYNNVLADRALLKNIPITAEERGSILGNLYFEKEHLNRDQASVIIKNINDPNMLTSDNLWNLYTHVSIVLKNAHPLDWIHDHTEVHNYLKNFAVNKLQTGLVQNDQLPGQLNLFEETPDLVSGEEVNQFYEL